MCLKVVFEESDSHARIRPFTSKKDGKTYEFTEQTCYVYGVDKDGIADRHPYKTKITLGKDQQPYPPGDYVVHPSSIRLTNFGQMVETNLRICTVDEFVELMKRTLHANGLKVAA